MRPIMHLLLRYIQYGDFKITNGVKISMKVQILQGLVRLWHDSIFGMHNHWETTDLNRKIQFSPWKFKMATSF